MGQLVNLTTGQRIVLAAHHVIGRSRRADLRIDDGRISGEHASIRWTEGGWQLVDLGSRNGTFHDDCRIDAGARIALTAGAVLGFGGRDESWRMDDAAPPDALAEAVDSGAVVAAIDHMLALPDESAPGALIYRVGGSWIVEQGDVSAPVADGDELEVDGVRWRLRLPEAIAMTVEPGNPAGLDVEGMRLRFVVSRDEEHVHAFAVCGDVELDLRAHAHHYTLLTLARLRQRDAADPELPASSHGWIHIDDLVPMLRLDESQVNVHIYRARRQLAKLGVANAALIVERRSYRRQLRLGIGRIDIATA